MASIFKDNFECIMSSIQCHQEIPRHTTQYLVSYSGIPHVHPQIMLPFPRSLAGYRSRADLIFLDPINHGRSEAAGARTHLRGEFSRCMCSYLLDCLFFFYTFCWGVAVPSVPERQFSTWFLFPKDKNSLKQALALMTDLQESLLTSQGPSDRADEMKTRRRLVWIRIVSN
jgi:hypothetical protein